ncbi:hypothetical protein [Sphaerisporangium fuscum]|uniref:hypothetical protein n=1 Tax=Sphaerisporangium fuscum TaxID=2835868 RepID=UPI001BDD6DB3|nr:hypothetical protein [Sphaerisporangium fuscum]
MKRFVGPLSGFLLASSAILAVPAAADAAVTSVTARPAAVAAHAATVDVAASKGVKLTVSFGRCTSACQIHVEVSNRGRYNIDWVGGTCTLKVNGRKVGIGHIYIGAIKRGHSRSSNCYVVSSRLSRAWEAYQNGDAAFNRYISAQAYYHYHYYR